MRDNKRTVNPTAIYNIQNKLEILSLQLIPTSRASNCVYPVVMGDLMEIGEAHIFSSRLDI
jgi:hypothetical protein